MKKEIRRKIESVKALQNASVEDILAMPEFTENLGKYLKAQQEDRKAIRASYEAMKKLGGAKGYKLPSHPLDHFSETEPETFAEMVREVLAGVSRLPVAQRNYIRQLGLQAYSLTVAQIVIKEYPELEDELIPKNKDN